ncbi:Lrp/AsnC family transcriptional regulator, partial [Clostridioides difficile]|nr:Lrp/AsnC family transcriptional regulator [Clostridioides difficile]
KNIAEIAFLSSPAVSARIEKLERDKIITGYHAAVDSRKLGYHITAFISLDVTSADKIRFYGDMESIPNVLECNCVTGEYSMLVKVAFP